jgi:stage II sporulation protein M
VSRANIRRKGVNFAFLSSDYKLLLLLIFTVTGILAGSFLVRGIGGESAQIGNAFNRFLERRAGQGFPDVFLSSLFTFLMLLTSAYFTGLFVPGVPVSCAIMFYRGLGFGVVAGGLYCEYGLKGALFSFLILSPGFFVSVFLLLLACREAFTFSAMLFSALAPAFKPRPLWEDFKLYNKRFLFLLSVTVAAALLDALVTLVFFGLFKF